MKFGAAFLDVRLRFDRMSLVALDCVQEGRYRNLPTAALSTAGEQETPSEKITSTLQRPVLLVALSG